MSEVKKMFKYTWDCLCDGSPFDEATGWFYTQEEAYEDMLKSATSKSTWACGWDDLLERNCDEDDVGEDGIVRDNSYRSMSFSGRCFPDRIELDPGTGKYVYSIHSSPCKCTHKQYLAVLDWARKADGYDGAIGGMVDAFLWYPNDDEERKALQKDYWWDGQLDKWNEIPPCADYVMDMAKKDGISLCSAALKVAEEMADKCDVLNRETRERVEKMRTRKFRVGFSAIVNTNVEVEANDETEAYAKAKELVLSRFAAEGATYELSTNWDLLGDEKDGMFVPDMNPEGCTEVK